MTESAQDKTVTLVTGNRECYPCIRWTIVCKADWAYVPGDIMMCNKSIVNSIRAAVTNS